MISTSAELAQPFWLRVQRNTFLPGDILATCAEGDVALSNTATEATGSTTVHCTLTGRPTSGLVPRNCAVPLQTAALSAQALTNNWLLRTVTTSTLSPIYALDHTQQKHTSPRDSRITVTGIWVI